MDHANRLFLSLNDNLTENIRRGYPFYHRSHIMALKTIWDYYVGWTTTDPQLYHEIYLDPELTKAMSNLITRVIAAQARMLHLFESWAAMTEENPSSFGFIDYIEDLPTLRDLFVTNLPPKTDRFRVILKNLREAVNRIEELACVIFFMAVEELMPSQTARLPDWINITAISLDPDRWEADGLFQPKTKPRDLTPLRTELERLFDREEAATPPV